MKALIKFNTITKATVALATVSLAILACPSAKAEAKKTPVQGVEENYTHVPGHFYTDGANLFVFGRACSADENIDDPRLNGRGTFAYSVNAVAGVFWGAARIVPEIGGGEWSGYWQATMVPATTIWLTLQGSGNYAGLVARLTYTPGTVPGTLNIEGYIVEAKGGPGERPFHIKACRTERLGLHNCVEVDPVTFEPLDPPVQAQILKADIVSEVGEATHGGLTSNEGFVLLDPTTGTLTGMGTGTAANGDALRWVYFGPADATTGAAGSVHFCGGTGRFADAVGDFAVEVQERMPDADDPLLSDVAYTGSGTIRY